MSCPISKYIEAQGDVHFKFPMFVKEAGVTSSTPTFDTTIAAISQKKQVPPKTQPTVTGCFPVTTPSYPCETNEDGKTSNDLDMS